MLLARAIPTLPEFAESTSEPADSKELVDAQLKEIYQKINQDKRKPKLLVEVNLSEIKQVALAPNYAGRIEPIVVFEGDTAATLADDFAKKHALNESQKVQL